MGFTYITSLYSQQPSEGRYRQLLFFREKKANPMHNKTKPESQKYRCSVQSLQLTKIVLSHGGNVRLFSFNDSTIFDWKQKTSKTFGV